MIPEEIPSEQYFYYDTTVNIDRSSEKMALLIQAQLEATLEDIFKPATKIPKEE